MALGFLGSGDQRQWSAFLEVLMPFGPIDVDETTAATALVRLTARGKLSCLRPLRGQRLLQLDGDRTAR